MKNGQVKLLRKDKELCVQGATCKCVFARSKKKKKKDWLKTMVCGGGGGKSREWICFISHF